MTLTPTATPRPAERRGSHLRLQHRILLPMAAAALLSTSAATYVGVQVTSTALRSRLESQLVNSVSAVTWRDFATNPRILQNLSTVVGAQVVTFGPGAAVVASSLETGSGPVVDAARRLVVSSAPVGMRPRVADADCGYPCLIAFREVDGSPGTVVALVANATPLASATTAVVRTMLVAAVLSLVVLVVVSQVVVHRVTAPLDRLVRFARTVTPQDSRARADVGDDEIGALAEAFNGMLDRLEQSRAALVQSEKLGLAGLFAARVAHDVRNPLSSIKMQTQLLRSKPGASPEDRETFTSVLHDIEQVESVVRDLMELANPGALSLRPADLNTVVRDALQQVAAQFAYRKIQVEQHLADGLPPALLDPPRLKQALLNVLVNGSEAMHTGGTLEVSTGAGGDGTVWARICDDGVGLDPAVGERVFDPFVSTKPNGVGLGLVNVKAVVEGHGGGIRLEPRQPRGTAALIWIPASTHG